MTMLPKLSLAAVLTHWQFHVVPSVVTLVSLTGYLVGLGRAAGLRNRWPLRRTVCWAAGWLLFAVTTESGIDTYGQVLFWIHMVEHLLLIMVVPLLLVVGSPLRLFVAAGSDPARLHSRLSSAPIAVLTHPVTGLLLYTATIVGTHLTGFMDQMMAHPWLAVAEQLAYVLVGTIFFLPLIGDEPLRWRLDAPTRAFVLVLSMPVDTFTGVVLSQASRYPWPAMAAMHPSWAPSLLADLHGGGAVMWIGGDAIMVVVAGSLLATWSRSGHLEVGAGRWLESIRANRIIDPTRADTDAEARIAVASDADSDAQFDAYNRYLERLNHDGLPQAGRER
jgi:cytochrome c oxidase assembly factor CtaG